MSRVQSIRRAFSVLGALADGPIGVTEVAIGSDCRKARSHGSSRALAARGRRRAGPRRHALPRRRADRARWPARRRPGQPREPRPADPRGAGRGGWRGDRPEGPRRLPGPLHRPGRHPERGAGPRLDGHAGPDARRPVRAGFLAYLPAPELARFLGQSLEQFTPEHDHGRGRAPEPPRPDPGRGPSLGPRGVRRRHQLGGGGRPGRRGRPVAAIHVHGPSYRFPTPGRRAADLGAPGAAAGRISASLGRGASELLNRTGRSGGRSSRARSPRPGTRPRPSGRPRPRRGSAGSARRSGGRGADPAQRRASR